VARLTNPETGTVLHVEGDLEQQYRDQGWQEVAEEKAKPKRSAKK